MPGSKKWASLTGMKTLGAPGRILGSPEGKKPVAEIGFHTAERIRSTAAAEKGPSNVLPRKQKSLERTSGNFVIGYPLTKFRVKHAKLGSLES